MNLDLHLCHIACSCQGFSKGRQDVEELVGMLGACPSNGMCDAVNVNALTDHLG